MTEGQQISKHLAAIYCGNIDCPTPTSSVLTWICNNTFGKANSYHQGIKFSRITIPET